MKCLVEVLGDVVEEMVGEVVWKVGGVSRWGEDGGDLQAEGLRGNPLARPAPAQECKGPPLESAM